MCGIFGGIGNNVNPAIIRGLALVNRERGTDSLGLFNSLGKTCKRAGDPLALLIGKDFNGFIDWSCHNNWFVAGHTRWATKGSVIDANSHPFRYGNIIGSHNGIVDAPKEYTVDSEYLFDKLNKAGGDYQKALAGVRGSWGLSWFDGDSFWLHAHNQEVAIGQADNGTWYYSSDFTHLIAAAGYLSKVSIIRNDKVVRVVAGASDYEVMPDLEAAPFVVKKSKKQRRAERRALRVNAHRDEVNSDPFYVGGDEWADAWAGYTNDDYKENDERLD